MSFIPITALLFFPIDLLISSMFPSIIIGILYFSHIFENLLFVLSELSFETITNFTFYMAVPVMAGASLLKLVKFGFAFTSSEIIILFNIVL